MKIIRKAGDTSNILQVFVQDSSSTTGAGLTGLVFNTASLTAYYHKDIDTTATAITLVTMTVGTFTSSGFKEIDATNMPGWYQFCPPDTAFSSGKAVGFHLKGATNMAPLAIEVQLVSVDVQDATAFGLSRIDAAITSRMATYTQPTGFLAATFPSGTIANTTNITSITGNITGNLSGSVGSVTGAVGSVTGNVGGNVVGSVASVTARVTANTDQLNGVASAASNLSKSAKAIVRGTCSGGTTTTAVVSSMTTPGSLTATGQLIGRTILFDDDTATAALQGQASNITNSTTGATPTITFTAMTTAPANSDSFSVV